MSLSKIRVAVLRGGPSREYEVSLKSGASVLQNLPEHIHPIDVFISKDGEWHVSGRVKDPHQVLRHVDVVFNALHGEYGEDGQVQHLLESHNAKFTGPNRFAAATSMNKAQTKEIYRRFGIKTPYARVVRRTIEIPALVRDLHQTFPMPCVIKPVSAGSSVGVYIAGTFETLAKALEELFTTEQTVLIEELIQGKEATCGVIDNFRNQPVYSLLPVEIVPPEGRFFDYESKYSGVSQERCPGNFSREETEELQELARKAHQALGLRHYSRTDFMISPKRGIYVLETNSLPGLTEESLLPKSLPALGIEFPDFLAHIVNLANK
jgi:D-alanine-D-alanine ligase